jgi:hypothetical protein
MLCGQQNIVSPVHMHRPTPLLQNYATNPKPCIHLSELLKDSENFGDCIGLLMNEQTSKLINDRMSMLKYMDK